VDKVTDISEMEIVKKARARKKGEELHEGEATMANIKPCGRCH
jgi:hypothetical protein